LGVSSVTEFLYPDVSEHSVCSIFIGLLMKMEQTVCSETLAHKIQTMVNRPKERIQCAQRGESLKSRIFNM